MAPRFAHMPMRLCEDVRSKLRNGELYCGGVLLMFLWDAGCIGESWHAERADFDQ